MTRLNSSGNRLRVLLLVVLVVGVGLLVLFRFDPARNGFYPFCLLYRTTGLLCPGCGGLRALHQLLHGNFGEAFRLNPLAFVVLPLLVVFAVRMWLIAGGKTLRPLPLKPTWVWIGLAALILFGIARNLPFLHLGGLGPG
jgi:hypothetical protein